MTPHRRQGDIWQVWGAEGLNCLCITTCNVISHRYTQPRLIMGAGSAAQAAQRFPEVPGVAAGLISALPDPDYLLLPISVPGGTLGLLQTKRSPWESSPAELVERALAQLARVAEEWGWWNVHLVKPGVGLGCLSHSEVDALLDHHLDGRFTVWTGSGDVSKSHS